MAGLCPEVAIRHSLVTNVEGHLPFRLVILADTLLFEADADDVFAQGRLEVALLRETLRADRSELRQTKRLAVVLAQVAARRVARELDPEFHAARHDCDFARRDAQRSQLGQQNERALLRSKSIAGVMTTAKGRTLVFAIFVNDVSLPKGVETSREGKLLGKICEIVYQHAP